MTPVSKERFVLTMFLVKHIDTKWTKLCVHVLLRQQNIFINSVALVVLSDAPIIVSIYSHLFPLTSREPLKPHV